MLSIKITILFLGLLCEYSLLSQSCSLACVDAECGNLNVAFTPQGGVEFCEGSPITFTNVSDAGFNYFIVDWSDGTKDTVYNFGPISHYYSIADSNLCNGDLLYEACFRGLKTCPAGISCSSGSYDFSLKVRPKAVLNMNSQYNISSPISCLQNSCNAETFLWNFGDGNTSSEPYPTHTYSLTGTYTISLIVNNDCGADTTIQQISIVEITSVKGNNLVGHVKVYPNPSYGLIYIDMKGLENINYILLKDMVGKIVVQKNIVDSMEEVLNLNELVAGAYILEIGQTNKSHFTYKIFKM